MHIIVDGYNLIRQSDLLRQQERVSLEAGRKALLRALAAYRRARGHRITVVFDGWLGGSPTEERDLAGGVEIIYSRLGEKADEVIKRLVQTAGEELLVVTSDREIAQHANRRGATAIGSPEFAARLDSPAGGRVHKETGKEEDEEEENEGRPGGGKKGPARRLSKQQRTALARLRKL
jgi:predicted RNA-binding protein with PIN domain